MTETLPINNSSVLEDSILEGLNPQQKEAVVQPVTTGVKVLAGAGTGKTQVISRRFLYLAQALKKEKIARANDRILVLTFTDKAAANMKDRINGWLKNNAEETLSTESWVSTFHTFANRILKSHAYWLGRTRDFELLDTMSQQVVFLRILKNIREGSADDISDVLKAENLSDISPSLLTMDHLNWLQSDAGLDGLDDLLKVSNVTGLINHIKSSGKSPRQFYDESVLQLDRLIQALTHLPCEYDENLSKVDHVTEYRRQWYGALKDWFGDSWSPFGEDDQKDTEIIKPFDFLKKAYLTCGSSKDKYVPIYFDTEVLKQQQVMAGHCLKVITAIYALYQQTLKQQNLCDFDDLIILTIQLLRENPSLRRQYQTQFKHIIVDEFQDSNGSQLELLKLLLSDDHTNLTVVGDIKQSIYGFRFAQPENMDLVFKTETGDRNPKVIQLPTNYRSTEAILNTANVITEAIVGDDSQNLIPATPQQNVRNDITPEVEWLTLGTKIEAFGNKGKPSDEAIGPQKEREVRFIAQKIATLVSQKVYRFEDFAILVKGHNKANEIQAVLNDCGIPSVLQKNKGFFKMPPIKDAVAALQLMKDLRNEAALVRLLQSKLTQQEIAQLCWLRKNQDINLFTLLQSLDTYVDQLDILPERLSALKALTQSLTTLRKRQARMTPLQMFLALSDQIGMISPLSPEWQKIQYRQYLKTFERFLFFLCSKSSITPTLSEVLDVVEEYQKDSNLELPLDDAGNDENAVKIMTVHAAKGLDFKVVFVAAVDAGKNNYNDFARLRYEPQYDGLNGYGLFITKWQGKSTLLADMHASTWKTPRSEAEDKRAFYVALTRAEEKMYVLTTHKATKEWMKGAFYENETLTHYDERTEEGLAHLEENHWHQPLPSFEKNKPTDNNNVMSPLPELDEDNTLAKTHLQLSFSAINTFEECPVKYWLRYQWRLPEPKDNAYGTNVGTGLHGLIQKHFVYQGNVSEALASNILMSWFPKTSPTELDTMLSMYRAFCSSEFSYSALHSQGYKILPEKRIRFPWQTKSGQANVLIDIDGVLDLLLYNPDKNQFKLIDFKTNKTLDSNKIAHYSEQLKLYQAGMNYLHPDIPLPDDNVMLVHLSTQAVKTIAVNPSVGIADLEAVIDDIASRLDDPTQVKIPLATADSPCRDCAYALLCPQSKV